MSQYVQDPEEAKEYSPMYSKLYAVIAIVTSILAIRLWYLQIIDGQTLREFSEKNRIKQVNIEAPRGLILDREGRILVDNLPGFVAIISPQYTEDLEQTAMAVGQVLEITPDTIIQKVQKSRRQNGPFFPVKIKENLTRDEVFRLKTLRLANPGLDIRETILRHYNLGQSGAQLFGYVGEISEAQIPELNKKYRGEHHFRQGDIIGRAGIEQAFESYIRGRDGVAYIQVDARGREAIDQREEFFGQKIQDQEATPGANLMITIDRDIQQAAWDAMMEDGLIGAVVALSSEGEVLAWVSAPSFDPNEFSTQISPKLWSTLINDPFKPFRNKVIQDHHPPGSTWKPLVALSALQEKTITANTIMDSPGYIRFGGRNYHDHNRGGHGLINVRQALERSSNIFFYRMGIELGVDTMAKYISLLGLGQRTGIELEQERTGLLPTSEWKQKAFGEPWQPGENLSTAIGQGFVLTTPLQMAVAYSTIAQKGKHYRPFLVRRILDPDMNEIERFEPQLVRDVSENGLSEEEKAKVAAGEKLPFIETRHFETVREGLWRVGNGPNGTARWHRVPGVEIAGKTGTSQVMALSADQLFAKCDERPKNIRHHGWFVGFAPYKNPEITVAVLAEHACSSGKAVPIARKIIHAYMEKHYPEVIAKGIEDQKLAWRRQAEERRRQEALAASANQEVTTTESEEE